MNMVVRFIQHISVDVVSFVAEQTQVIVYILRKLTFTKMVKNLSSSTYQLNNFSK